MKMLEPTQKQNINVNLLKKCSHMTCPNPSNGLICSYTQITALPKKEAAHSNSLLTLCIIKMQ